MADAVQVQIPNIPLSEVRAGFRLNRFEVFNWGTFHNHVWALTLDCGNTLLTGDIGSGKSTLVDGITTLLVPPQRLNYNKAAGAEERERNTRSYFLGYYKRERGESGSSARPVALREAGNSYSVLLAVFYNEALRQHVTLAQVFWAKDVQGPPSRLYIVANAALSVADHFSGFGPDIGALRKRLRGTERVEVHDTFPPYGSAYRRRFGIDHEQAMDLFHQTVSMKTVGNLTEFVREHMLQPFEVQSRIDALIAHFEDLNRAHASVLKAKEQIGLLGPMVADCDERDTLAVQVGLLRRSREALRPWFRLRKQRLLQERIEVLAAKCQKLQVKIDSEEEGRAVLRTRDAGLRHDINANGGDRIERIKREIAEREKEKNQRQQRAQKYAGLANMAGFPPAETSETFLQNHSTIQTELAAAETTEASRQNVLTDATIEFRRVRDQHAELDAELRSLRSRRSNIPRNMLDLRGQLCQATGLQEGQAPFAGELLQVRDEARDWEGAIERMLHSLGLSLLVADRDYMKVAEWVNSTHLRDRLVYYRVPSRNPVDRASANPAALVHKIGIQQETEFYGFLESHLTARFPHICCDSMEQFRREPSAITRTGQIKTRGERHEKDDRHAIGDRTRFVLGWSNEAKIAALEKDARDLEVRLRHIGERVAGLQRELREIKDRVGTLNQLSVFQIFQELDWRTTAVQIEQLQVERQELESRSDVLRFLQTELGLVEQALKESDDCLVKLRDEKTREEFKQTQAKEEIAECEKELANAVDEVKAQFADLEALSTEQFAEQTLTVENCAKCESDMRDWLQRKIDAEDGRIRRLGEKIVNAMSNYRNRYPVETQEADASIEAANEYRVMLHELQSEGLPRFEQRFKELLNENTIREVANFQSQLNRERAAIRERVDTINASLLSIDYNPGRYIVLEAENTPDTEIREFQQDLRACTEGTLTGSEDEHYSETKFLQVKRIIERFQGREGQGEIDRKWSRKVTDVRHWFTFSASERWREDNREFENYTDSGGKSGGQKEKLAYTVLAASLAYQFGAESGAGKARSFRFVVIDEAFGRGSDESARFGLELFQRLDLQLLIVTPLQKIHVIEPYVSNVGFVHINEGRLSMLRNLTIEEYRAERAERSGLRS